jgi:hypothetical protein
MTRNHASGGVRVSVARSHARRQSAAEMRATPVPDRSAGSAVVDMRRCVCPYPSICVQAVTQSWNGTQSFLPLSHVASGVFQNLIVLK